MFKHDSEKFILAEKKHIDSTPHLSGSKILDNVASSSHSLVIGEGSKTHFPARYSESRVHKTVKQFEAKRSGCIEDKQTGKRVMEAPKSDPLGGGALKTYDRRHLTQGPSKESDRITVDWTSRSIPVDEKSGQARNQKRSDEFKLSDVLTRKKSISTENQMRNNINVAAPGDKSYKVPEHSPGYYAQGGLIPGSSIVKRASAKPALQKREGTTTVQKTLSTMTYAQKVALEDERYEREQVLLLNNGSSTMGRPIPSWEERTGQYIISPEEEND